MNRIKYFFHEGWKGIWYNKGMSLASVGVIMCCLLLTGAAVLFSINLTALVERAGDNNTVMVFLDYDLSEKQTKTVGTQLAKIQNIAEVSFYPREEGIKEFREALQDLQGEFTGEDNPLPDAYKIRLHDLSRYDSTVKQIKKISGVQKISNRGGIAHTLTEISHMVTNMGLWVIFILGLISVFIVSNAIGATIYARRFEISIMKSVGATNSFVCIPFIVEGMLLGIMAGIVSTFFLKFLYEGLLSVFQMQYISNVEIVSYVSVTGYVFLATTLAGTLLGVLGAVVSLRKHLRREGNEVLGW